MLAERASKSDDNDNASEDEGMNNGEQNATTMVRSRTEAKRPRQIGCENLQTEVHHVRLVSPGSTIDSKVGVSQGCPALEARFDHLGAVHPRITNCPDGSFEVQCPWRRISGCAQISPFLVAVDLELRKS